MTSACAPVENGETRPRVILDTQVVLDAWWFGDARSRGLALAIEGGRLAWQATVDMRAELADVLGRATFAARPAAATATLAAFDRWARLHPPPCVGHAPRCSDADDQMFIDLAIDRGARWLFSRDRAVIALARPLARWRCVLLAPEDWSEEPTSPSGDPDGTRCARRP